MIQNTIKYSKWQQQKCRQVQLAGNLHTAQWLKMLILSVMHLLSMSLLLYKKQSTENIWTVHFLFLQ